MASFVGKFKSILGQQPEEETAFDDYYDDADEMDEEVQPEPEESSSVDIQSSDKVIPMRDTASVQFVLFKPEAFDQTVKDMADELMAKHTVILNVEDTNKDVSRRIIDFLGGVAYANQGNVKKVAEDTFIIMPSNVTLTGQDAMDEVGSDNVYF